MTQLISEKYKSNILIIDDDIDILTSAELFLEENFELIKVETNPKNIFSHLKKNCIDIVLLDMNFRKGDMDGYEGIVWLEKIKKEFPEIIVILMTAFGDIDLAINAIKKGAFDFVLKPWKNAKLLSTLISANRYCKSQKEKTKFKDQSEILSNDIAKDYNQMIGKSHAIIQVKETLQKVAETDTNVLLLGENGTGKELAARELHRLSKRSNEVFITIDMGAISETLFESEIFGHVKGAFTDAKSDKPGRFEIANNGTIFLDEIGNLSYKLQSKLLTVLQNRKISRVGSSIEIPINVRLVCATNMPLKEMIKEGEFRQDLYYRINTFEINIPSLEERNEDIKMLALFFLEKFKIKYGKPNLLLPEKAVRQLENYSWPGNIRELKNVIERSTILSEGNYLDLNLKTYHTDRKDRISTSLNIDENEKKLILRAIEKHKGNITKAAQELGIQRNALYRRLEKHGL